MLDIEKVKRVYDLLIALSQVNSEIRSLEGEVHGILGTSIELGIPADVIRGVEVKIEKRPFRMVKLSPLRCEETNNDIDGVAIGDYDIVLRGDYFKHEIRFMRPNIYNVLTLACNLEVSEVEALVNAVREKKKELEKDLDKLKELVAYAKLFLS
jgi:hypothetical protein